MGVCKVSASCQPLKVTLLVLFCSPSLPDLLCPWCFLMTPQSPTNFRNLLKAVRVRSSPASAKCKKFMRLSLVRTTMQSHSGDGTGVRLREVGSDGIEGNMEIQSALLPFQTEELEVSRRRCD